MKTASLPVLSVKYKIPGARKNYIIREGLMNKLNAIKSHAITIVKAGAGSGKTTLLSIFYKENHLHNFYWLNIDASLNQPCVFWKYIFSALEGELTGDYAGLRRVFEENLQKEMLIQILEAFAAQLQNEKDCYLVLDDFQFIQDQELLETINLFLQIMPEHLHLTLCTRTLPALNLGSLYMDNRLLMIDDEDMRLSSEECHRFLVHTLEVGKDEADDVREKWIREIIENANGWIGGAQLMAISGHELNDRYGILSLANESVIYDYIEKEIFNGLAEDEKQFLLETAVLSYFNEDICAKYIPEYQFDLMMKKISNKNLFVIMIDEEKQEYRYHAILREFLLHILEQDPNKKLKLYHKAANVLYESEDYDECVRLLFDIRDYVQLMDKLLKMPQTIETFSYMMRVPKEEIIHNKNFAFQYLFCRYATMELEECKEIYAILKQHFSGDETFAAFDHANLFFDVNWEFTNISVLSYEQIEKIPLNKVTKAYLLIKESYFLFLADRVQDAFLYLNQAEKIYEETHNVYIECFVIGEKTQILEEYGDFNKALDLYETMKDIIRDIPTMRCSYYIGIAGLHIRQLKLQQAKEELDQANQFLSKKTSTVSSAYLYTLAEWYYVSGREEEAIQIIEAQSHGKMYDSVFFSARLLRYPVYRGKNRKLAETFLYNYNNSEDLLKNMDTELLYVGIQHEIGDTENAEEMLEQLLSRARKSGNKLKIVECTLMKARFKYEKLHVAEDITERKTERIVNLIIEAVSYASNEEISVPFWFEKNFLIKFLNENQSIVKDRLKQSEYQYLTEILEISDDKIEASQQTLPYNLSEREMEVVQEIAKGKTNQQIADSLCISLATVKTHLINIYGKLGVNNRLSAVKKVTDSGNLL